MFFSLIAQLDARLVLAWGRILTLSERFIEKGAVVDGAFTFGLISGLLYVLKSIDQGPGGFGYTQVETMKTCLGIIIVIGLLRFFCARSVRVIKRLPIEASEKAMGKIQPFRPVTSFALLFIGIFGGLLNIGRYYAGHWYADGYSYLFICAICLIMGVYAHSASIYLDIKKKIEYERSKAEEARRLRLKELVASNE
jgi:hypothetical protein